MIKKKENQLRVCLISPEPPPYGGISNWTRLVHKFLASIDGVELYQLDTSPRWRKIFDLSIHKRILGGGFQLVRDLIRLLMIVIRNDPDVIHLTTSGSLQLIQNWIFAFIARIFHKPFILHIRFGRIPELAVNNTFEWKMLVKVIRLSSAVIGITPETCQTIDRFIPGTKIFYIPNPIHLEELPKQENFKSEEKLALFLGHVIATKGIRELVQAWVECNLQNWKLIIAGPVDQDFKNQLLDEYHPSNLSFIGELEHIDALNLMSRCDLFILPSYTEGFPNVILEAMALEKAIIATKVGAIPAMLADQCGLLIEPKNVAELKNAIVLLCQNSDIRKSLAKNAYDKVKREFSADYIIPKYINLWKSFPTMNRRFW